MSEHEVASAQSMKTRLEHDLIGDRQVPDHVYYGIHTLRALENFPVTGTPISIYPDLIKALASIKQAAALTNHDLGLLDNTPDAACESSALSLPERVDLFEKVVIEAELARHKGSVAATLEALGLPRKTFYDKLKKHGISRAEFSEPNQT